MGMARQYVGRGRDADQLKHAQRLGSRGSAVLALMQPNRFCDLFADREHGIQRCHRLLENHRDLAAADRAHRVVESLREIESAAIAPGEIETPAGDATTTVFDEAHQR